MARPTGLHAQHLFQATSVPVGLARLLHHILAERRTPTPSETILAKVLADRPEKVHGGHHPAARGLRNAATPSASTTQVMNLQAGVVSPK